MGGLVTSMTSAQEWIHKFVPIEVLRHATFGGKINLVNS